MMTGSEWLIERGYRAIDPEAHRLLGMHVEACSGRGLLLIGDPGTGKTLFCEIMVGGLNTVPCRRIVASAEETSVQKILSELRSMPSIALDDLGQEGKYYGRELMNDVIDELYSRHFGRVYVTTNLPLDLLNARYGDRTMSRLMAMTTVVRIKANDQRVNNRREAQK